MACAVDVQAWDQPQPGVGQHARRQRGQPG
jgi:hypothetical protein